MRRRLVPEQLKTSESAKVLSIRAQRRRVCPLIKARPGGQEARCRAVTVCQTDLEAGWRPGRSPVSTATAVLGGEQTSYIGGDRGEAWDRRHEVSPVASRRPSIRKAWSSGRNQGGLC